MPRRGTRKTRKNQRSSRRGGRLMSGIKEALKHRKETKARKMQERRQRQQAANARAVEEERRNRRERDAVDRGRRRESIEEERAKSGDICYLKNPTKENCLAVGYYDEPVGQACKCTWSLNSNLLDEERCQKRRPGAKGTCLGEPPARPHGPGASLAQQLNAFKLKKTNKKPTSAWERAEEERAAAAAAAAAAPPPPPPPPPLPGAFRAALSSGTLPDLALRNVARHGGKRGKRKTRKPKRKSHRSTKKH